MPRHLPFVLLAGLVAVSTAATMIRFAGDPPNNVPSLAIATWRLGLAALLLVPITLATNRLAPDGLRAWTREQWRLALLSGLLLGLHFATWITSLSLTTVASSVTLVATTPVWVALGSVVFLRERPGRLAWGGVLVATAGAIGLALLDAASSGASARGGSNAALGDALALAGALGAAGYFLIGRRLRDAVALRLYVQVVYGVAAVCLLVVALATGTPLGGFPGGAYVWLVLLALGPQLVGHTSLNWGLRHVTPSTVAALTLAEPIGSMLLAVLLLREAITPEKVLGAAVILVGIYLVARAEGRRASTPRVAVEERL